MNGIYGYDGYIYQTVVSLFLLLDALLDPKRLFRYFFLEVNDKNGQFSFDIVIVTADGKKAYFYEIKGGQFTISNVLKKLGNSVEYFRKKKLIGDNCKAVTKIIYKNEKQLPLKIDKENNKFLLQVSNSLNIISSTKPSFSALEYDTMTKIRELVRKIIPNFDSESHKIRIYLAWRHFVEVQIQYLAEKLRQTNKQLLEKITLEEFLKNENLFCDILAEVCSKQFSNKEDVYASLTNNLINPNMGKQPVRSLTQQL